MSARDRTVPGDNLRTMLRSRSLRGVLLAIVVLVVVEALFAGGWLWRADLLFYDLWHNLAGRRAQPRHVAIVAIDDQTLMEHRDEPLVFWGPHFARAIEVLGRVGARAVGIDYFFAVSAESWFKKLGLPKSDESRTYDIPMRTQLAAGRAVLAGTVAGNEQGGVEVRTMTTKVAPGLRRIPVLLKRIGSSRAGETRIRSAGGAMDIHKPVSLTSEEEAEIQAARETSRKLRSQVAADDVTPELFLLGVLADYEQYEEMAEELKSARRRQPGNGELKGIEAWVTSKLRASGR